MYLVLNLIFVYTRLISFALRAWEIENCFPTWKHLVNKTMNRCRHVCVFFQGELFNESSIDRRLTTIRKESINKKQLICSFLGENFLVGCHFSEFHVPNIK